MSYFINGEKVTREEFLANSQGLPLNEPVKIQISTFKEFISPIDGSVIASTQQLRNHERQHGVRQVGNDFINQKSKYHD